MAKRVIKVELINGLDKIELSTSAIVLENKIKYNEDGIFVVLEKYDNGIILTRKNDEYQLILRFEDNKKTKGNYLLINEMMTFDLDIFTKKLIVNDEEIHIVYELNDEIRDFKIRIGK